MFGGTHVLYIAHTLYMNGLLIKSYHTSTLHFAGTIENYIDARVSHRGPSNAVINCIFLNNQTLYCLVCCSTDPSVPPDTSVYNTSTTRDTKVTVFLQGLTSGQMYYCTAAGTYDNSSSCGGPVYKDMEAYFSISAGTCIMCYNAMCC